MIRRMTSRRKWLRLKSSPPMLYRLPDLPFQLQLDSLMKWHHSGLYSKEKGCVMVARMAMIKAIMIVEAHPVLLKTNTLLCTTEKSWAPWATQQFSHIRSDILSQRRWWHYTKRFILYDRLYQLRIRHDEQTRCQKGQSLKPYRAANASASPVGVRTFRISRSVLSACVKMIFWLTINNGGGTIVSKCFRSHSS